MTSTATETVTDTTALPAAARLLDALTRRDFAALAQALSPTVAFRALVPRGPFELTGAEAVADKFTQWFGGPDTFDVVDASIGPVGIKTSMRWRVRMCAADGSARIVEQHAFATGGTQLDSIDLLCSGFHTEGSSR
jgi:deoxyribodipyrimidine photolyase